jgi:hypothetical protein
MAGDKLYELNYMEVDKIMHFKMLVNKFDENNARKIYESFLNETDLPDYSDFILDAFQANGITRTAIGVLMESLNKIKKAKGYAVLVLNEEFLRKIMVDNPEMFNYLAVFHSAEDAVKFIKKSRTGT